MHIDVRQDAGRQFDALGRQVEDLMAAIAPHVTDVTALPLPAAVTVSLLTTTQWQQRSARDHEALLASEAAELSAPDELVTAIRAVGAARRASYQDLPIGAQCVFTGGELSIVLLPENLAAGDDELHRVLSHELVHVAQDTAAGRAFRMLHRTLFPVMRGSARWDWQFLVEGHAVWAEEQITHRVLGYPVGLAAPPPFGHSDQRPAATAPHDTPVSAHDARSTARRDLMGWYRATGQAVSGVITACGLPTFNAVWTHHDLLPTHAEAHDHLAWQRRLKGLPPCSPQEGAPTVMSGYSALTPARRRDVRILADLPVTDLDARAVAAVLEITPQTASRFTSRLAAAGLLERLEDRPLYRVPDTVRHHVTSQREAGPSRTHRAAAVRRLLVWMLATSQRADAVLTPPDTPAGNVPVPHANVEGFADPLAALRWQGYHQNNLLSLLRDLASATDVATHRMCWQLVDSFWVLVQHQNSYRAFTAVHELGVEAAQRAGDDTGVRKMLSRMAIGLRESWRFDEAAKWYGRAQAAAQAAGDVRDVGEALVGLAQCHLGLRQLDLAEAACEEAQRLWRSCHFTQGEAQVGTLLAQVAEARHDYPTALELLTAVHDAATSEGDVFVGTRALAMKGYVLSQSGQGSQGIAMLEKAKDYLDKAGGARAAAWTRTLLAQAHVPTDLATASKFARNALGLYAGFGLPEAELLRALTSI